MAFSAGSVTANAYTTSANVPAAGVYHVIPKFGFGDPPWFTEQKFIEARHFIPGVGIGTTRLGDFGPTTIHADLIFVDTTTAAAEARFVTALAVFVALARYSVVCRGKTFAGCKLLKDSVHKIGQEFRGGMAHVVYHFEFEHLG